MSNLKTHINPLAKAKNNSNNKSKIAKTSKLTNQFSWIIVLVFSVSTFTALGLIFNEIKGSVGLAAPDLAGYSTWKTQYGLNGSDADANWNKAGDGISNYNKYLLNLNPKEVVDGSVLVAKITGTDMSTGGGTKSADFAAKLGISADPNSKTIETNGPSLAANTSTGATTNTGIKPNIAESTSPKSADPTNNVPILGNPTPNNLGQIVASNPNSIPDGSKVALNSSSTVSSGNSQAASTTTGSAKTSLVNSDSSSGTVKTSGTTATDLAKATTATSANLSGATANSIGGTAATATVKTSGISSGTPVAGKNTVTVRTGGEFSVVLFLAGLASLASGSYILKTKFTKNSLVVEQGEK